MSFLSWVNELCECFFSGRDRPHRDSLRLDLLFPAKPAPFLLHSLVLSRLPAPAPRFSNSPQASSFRFPDLPAFTPVPLSKAILFSLPYLFFFCGDIPQVFPLTFVTS